MNIDRLSDQWRRHATQLIKDVLEDLDRREPDGNETLRDTGGQERDIARKKLNEIKSKIESGGLNGVKSAFSVSALKQYKNADISQRETILGKVTGQREIFLPHRQR